MDGREDEELKKRDTPLREVDSILTDFARRYSRPVKVSYYHDWPSREISFAAKAKSGSCILGKSIYLRLESWNAPFTYKLVVIIWAKQSVPLGDILASCIPYLRRIVRGGSKRQFRMEKEIASFKEEIPSDRLLSLLEEAKKVIDDFDESGIQEF